MQGLNYYRVESIMEEHDGPEGAFTSNMIDFED